MGSRAWAWLVALLALVLGVIPLVGMTGVFGLPPMSNAAANLCWIAALVMAVVTMIMSFRQGMKARARG